MLTSEEIESLLSRLRDGSESVESVSARLVAAESDRPAVTSLAAMILDHGSAPPNVVDRWCEQLRSQVECSDVTLPADAADLTQWNLGEDGKLVAAVPIAVGPIAELTQDAKSIDDWLESFRRAVSAKPETPSAIGSEIAIESVADSPVASESFDHGISLATESDGQQKPPKIDDKQKRGPFQPKWIAVAVAGCIAIAIGYWVLRPSESTLASSNQSIGTSLPNKNVTGKRSMASAPRNQSSGQLESLELQTFDQLSTQATVDGGDPLQNEFESINTIRSFEPPPMDLSVAVNEAAEEDSTAASSEMDAAMKAMLQSTEQTTPIEAPGNDSPSVELSKLEDDEGPRETKQKAASVAGPNRVELASPRDPEDERIIAKQIPNEISIDFVSGSDNDISLRKDSPELWTISSPQESLATIKAIESGLQWRWTQAASKASSATRDVINARLRIDDDWLYLRHLIVGSPYSFHFGKSDIKPAWDLGVAVESAKTSLGLHLVVPDSYQIAWIEPIDDLRLPGGRAIGVVTGEQQEGAAIGIRLDLRCGRRLSARVRYAGRLGSNLPWMLLSHRTIDAAADSWVFFAEAVQREAVRLDGVDEVAYEIAGRQGKRIIAEKIRRNDIRLSDARTALKRIADLKGMMIRLENEGRIDAELVTHWPDDQQSILTTMSSNE